MKALIYLLVMGVAAGAYAAGRQAPLFTDIDLDSDQQITQQELTTFHQARMSEQQLEGRQRKNATMGPNIEMFDSNGDGVVSVDEFDAMQSRQMRANQPMNRKYQGQRNNKMAKGFGKGNG
jgi:Ca2+-binding EF-hand superfamily protein